ncbi:MAG: ABC transporter ATP-binding protein [Spirochaetes bacterium]|nr:ABC transporter ATP-binding protein [Spirochaetota bacterium]
MSKIIEIDKLVKKYKNGNEELVVLDQLDLLIDKGSKIIITGESGRGKSTLLNIIGGLDKGTSGVVNILGQDIETMTENELYNFRNKVMGFVFQFHYLIKELTAAENVMMPYFISGHSRKKSLGKAEELLEKVNLKDRSSFYPYQLSGGERQRVAVARSLINNPSIIIADEPTGNLDEKNARIVEDILFDLVQQHEVTLVMVTHEMKLAMRGDFVMKLEKGKLQPI